MADDGTVESIAKILGCCADEVMRAYKRILKVAQNGKDAALGRMLEKGAPVLEVHDCPYSDNGVACRVALNQSAGAVFYRSKVVVTNREGERSEQYRICVRRLSNEAVRSHFHQIRDPRRGGEGMFTKMW
ncbi:MAG: hypothetical protein M1530_03430 [Candidatus Marsarchaeota archaeon]|nr:hypothetical protein [Candidatus Marsarchaeota archaeon]